MAISEREQNFRAEVAAASLRIFGRDDMLINTDLILVIRIMEFERSLPVLGRTHKVAIDAIVQLAKYDVPEARELVTHLV